MEALWTKFLPHYHTVLQMIRDGKIGEIKVLLQIWLQACSSFAQRIYDPALAGGTMLDIGIYNVLWC